ncbi:FAD binding domain-containing protein [Thamnocephalis sphaerospora]|uniref:FAD binding domain-containing protein n=1 Tax=Thamnocephalis sphaerospora TaxID=78915 RepID=A0A4P9XUB2_9FUNG|nr:FAD binding domain-containing protein [Thamnocephalis sphaerospora]|eukprot:RKP09807.1 FAD binding domain-containing protein [Thamnocephalis sphaerospora]
MSSTVHAAERSQASQRQPVAVIGAGAAGLTCAIILTELGVPVEIYERNLVPAVNWRAPGIHARTMELLARYKLVERFYAEGSFATSINFLFNGVHVGGPSFDQMRTEFPGVFICAQPETERILRERLEELGVPIHWGMEFVDYTLEEGDVVARFRPIAEDTQASGHTSSSNRGSDDEELVAHRFAYVVGCDGGHSRVRKAIGAVFNGRTLDSHIAICDMQMKADWLSQTWQVEQAFNRHADGVIGSIRIRPDEYRVFISWDDDLPEITAEIFVETARHRMLPHDIGNPKVLSFSKFTINERRASRYVSKDDRVFICGDAAHVHSPAGGQGMNLSMQDAENLAWKLAMVYHGQTGADILKTYPAERIPVADEVLKLSGSLYSNVLTSPRKASVLRVVMPIFDYLPISITRSMSERMGQLRVVYSSENNAAVSSDSPSWTAAANSDSAWWPSNWFAEDLCVPGARALDGVALDALAAERPQIRLRNWQSTHLGAHVAVVFIDCRMMLGVGPQAHTETVRLDDKTIADLQNLAVVLSPYRPTIPAALILYGHEEAATAEHSASAILDAAVAQLHRKFPAARVLIDADQGDHYDHLGLAALYACTRRHEHIAYLIRPDAYVAGRSPLSFAAELFNHHLEKLFAR